MNQELLELGFIDLAGFLCLEATGLIPIPHKHAEHMYKKFQDSSLANDNLIKKIYVLAGDSKLRFIDLLGANTDISLYLIVVPENYHANLENTAQHLQFAFKFPNKPNYYILLNCTNAIEINKKDFDDLQDAVTSSGLTATLDINISAERETPTVNTKRINIHFSDNSHNNSNDLYFYPTIRTLNIFQIQDIDKENVAQLFSFGLMISNEQIGEEVDGAPYRVFSNTALVNDRFQNCPPLVCP